MITQNGNNKKAFTQFKSAMSTTKRRYLRGFTLIELLVVCAIIGVLATVVIINLMGAKSKSRYARVVSDMTNIATAVRAYSVGNNNIYPNDQNQGIMLPELNNYLPGGWPQPSCNSYLYDYQNWNTSCNGGAGAERIIGVTFYTPTGTPSGYYTLDIKNLLKYCGPAGSFNQSIGQDILNISPKEITCHE
jgi:prepilin-type N-terminal cleavage/methylation domain-containing protein